MTKKTKKQLSRGIAAFIFLVGIYFYYMIYEGTSVVIFIGLFIAVPVIEGVLNMLLNNKKTSKKSVQRQPSSKNIRVKEKSNRLLPDKELINISLGELSWREFERLCFLYFKAMGYKPRETRQGADGGVDLIIYNRYHKADEAIQIKHYIHSKNQITIKTIRELNSAKRNHNCILSRFITSSTYTKKALKQADDLKMTCNDITWVTNKLVKWQEQERMKRVGKTV
ncbi:restriction endonuclease [Salipaludibacillus neizhouensis]|uniref:Restriction endonuclease n=1 Tax=Salipaludibacillus neizhouensis TaxID=885475 RepID=A0A3A9KFS9_9BACI|nr:restriction endonuclease [Salipaludibacillus neizhouensis]RKL66485.1 restriction endonuclease [Salipaludibacillus neizhouensis]